MINNKLHKQIINNKVKTDLNNDHNDNKKGDSHKNPCRDFLGQLEITATVLNSTWVTTPYLGSKTKELTVLITQQ